MRTVSAGTFEHRIPRDLDRAYSRHKDRPGNAGSTCRSAVAYGDVHGDGTVGVVPYTRGIDAANICPSFALPTTYLPVPTKINEPVTYTDLIPPSAPF